MNTVTQGTTARFWADDFDMDLLKLFPQLPQMLGITGEVKLWTVGHESFGRLNHPTVWNSHGAFFWTEKPNLARDKHGWFNVDGCVCDSLEIECTWMEVLRDQWPHSYAFILKPSNVLFDAPPSLMFSEIMYDLRGLKKSVDIRLARQITLQWFMRSSLLLDQVRAA